MIFFKTNLKFEGVPTKEVLSVLQLIDDSVCNSPYPILFGAVNTCNVYKPWMNIR